MKGLILTNAYSQMPSSVNQALRIKEEFGKYSVECDIMQNDHMSLYIKESDIYSDDQNLLSYDFCVYLDKDRYISKMLEKKGLRLFNSSRAIEVCDDKFETYIMLSGHGIKMAETYPGMLCYDPKSSVKESLLDKIEEKLGYPVIIKESYGSLGKGVYMATNRVELKEISQKLINIPHIFQRAIMSSLGKDIRVIVIGDRVIASMLRHSDTDFRSNIELGGRGTTIELSQKDKDLCIHIAKVLGLDYCGIDLLIGDDGRKIVCEVNSNAFFGGIEKVTGTNVASEYCEYIINTMKNR